MNLRSTQLVSNLSFQARAAGAGARGAYKAVSRMAGEKGLSHALASSALKNKWYGVAGAAAGAGAGAAMDSDNRVGGAIKGGLLGGAAGLLGGMAYNAPAGTAGRAMRNMRRGAQVGRGRYMKKAYADAMEARYRSAKPVAGLLGPAIGHSTEWANAPMSNQFASDAAGRILGPDAWAGKSFVMGAL